MTDALIWLGVMIGFLVAEAATTQLYCIWFALGALITAFISFANMSTTTEIIIFLVLSILMLLFTRKFAVQVLKAPKTATNTDSVVGAIGEVTDKLVVITGEGRVLVNGLKWKAQSVNGEDIEAGTHVKILEIRGVTVVVEPVQISAPTEQPVTEQTEQPTTEQDET